MQESVKQYAERCSTISTACRGRIRVGLNSGEVVVRSIGSDLHMDYTAVGQTTHLAARMEQMPTRAHRDHGGDAGLAEGFVKSACSVRYR